MEKLRLPRMIFAFAVLCALLFSKPDGILSLALYLAAYLVVGFDVIFGAFKNIFRGELFDECFLMSVATAGAFFIGEYEEAVFVMLFYQLGEFFCDAAEEKSRKSILSLATLRPDTATVIRNGAEVCVSSGEITVGDFVLIKPGEKIAVDGEITEGSTSVDSSSLTGESLSREKSVGDRVLCGEINLDGVIKVRCLAAFEESTAARIVTLIEQASEKKSKTENFITRFSRIYTPCVVFGAALLFFVPVLFFRGEAMLWLRRALTALVVSCPCALVVSVPLTFFGGIGGASRRGILIKGSGYIEKLSRAEVVALDKTGTLTSGAFSVTGAYPENISKEELVELAATAESHLSHPIARSIVSYLGREPDTTRIGEMHDVRGRGVSAVIDGRRVLVGSARLMAENGIPNVETSHSKASVYVARDGEYLGRIELSDKIKPDAGDTLRELKRLSVKKTVMLTGDSAEAANAVGKEVGIDEVKAGLLPDDKVSAVESLMEDSGRGTLVFVGDGINDAPVIMRSDVGVAMGALGSDAAVEAADIVIADDRLSKLPQAMRIARKTVRISRENVAFSIGIKAAILVLIAFGLADMRLAAFGDVGVLVLAVLNALRAMHTTECAKK